MWISEVGKLIKHTKENNSNIGELANYIRYAIL